MASKFQYTSPKQVKVKKAKSAKFSYTNKNQIKIHKKISESVKLRPLMEMVLFEQVIDKLTVLNPKTKKRIKVKSALQYEKSHPAYQAALALIKKKKITVPKELSKSAKPGEQGELFYQEPFETGDITKVRFNHALSGDEALEHLRGQQKDVFMNEDAGRHTDSLRSYIGSGYVEINNQLRTDNAVDWVNQDVNNIMYSLVDDDNKEYDKLDDDEKAEYLERAFSFYNETIDNKISDMDWLIAQRSAALINDIISYRGINNPDLVEEFRSLKPGDSYTDAGFVSTSLDEEVAKTFAGQQDAEHGIVIEILNKKGNHVLFPLADPDGDSSLTEGEKELILQRGMEFRILSVDKSQKDIRIRVEPIIGEEM